MSKAGHLRGGGGLCVCNSELGAATCEAAAPRGPGEGSLNDPAARLYGKAALAGLRFSFKKCPAGLRMAGER